MTIPTTDLSFDPCDPYFPVPGEGAARWAVQIFTEDNGYGVDADSAVLDTPDSRTVRMVAHRYARLGQQVTADPGEVEAVVSLDGSRLTIRVHARHPEPIKSVKLLLRGLPPAALRDGWWSPTTPEGVAYTGRFQWTYPGPEWATRWAAAGEGAGAVSVSVRDPGVHAAALHVGQPPYAGEPIVEMVLAAPAHARDRQFQAPPVRLSFAGSSADLEADLEDHLDFVGDAFGLVAWDQRRDVPEWLRETALVVALHGQHWTGHVFNTFEQMSQTLKFIADHADPARVLAYLPGWEGRYYHSYPDYRPGADLGGDAGFGRLVETARELGVRLMPMFGAHGANIRRYGAWSEAAIRNDTDRYVDLVNRPDWDGDRFGEGDQVFLNPGEPGFRHHLTESIGDIVAEFGVDAAFLDTAGFWFNDPRHPLFPGLRELVATLRARHPDLLLAAEGWWDAMLGLFPLSQQWLGWNRDFRAPRLLTRYARSTGHLAEGTPGAGSTGVHEEGFRPRQPSSVLPGHIPQLSFAEFTLSEHRDEVAQICRAAACPA